MGINQLVLSNGHSSSHNSYMGGNAFEALDADYEIDKEAYLEYFRKMHQLFPKCKKMVMAVRNQIASSHHTLSGLLYDAVEDQLYTTRIYDIEPIVDPMGVGDAGIAAIYPC